MPLSENEVRFLTEEVLKECWHDSDYLQPWKCQKCGKAEHPSNRTFTRSDDFFAIRNKLVEGNKFGDFKLFMYEQWDKINFNDQPDFDIWWTATDPDGVYRIARLALKWKGVE